MAEKMEKPMEDIEKSMSELTVLSFRKMDEIKKLAKHFQYVINHPMSQGKLVLLNYLKNLDETHKRIFLQKREVVEVEYIFTTEKKSSLQRQRFNSLPISEVPELLKAELLTDSNAKQVHICTDCDVEIELNDEVPLIESLQNHFKIEAHMPKLKRESVDVAEPIVLPNMSRRLSAMEVDSLQQSMDQIIHHYLKPDLEVMNRAFSAKLEASLIRYLPDNSEASVDAAVKFYQDAYNRLCLETAVVDFSAMTGSVAPIIMSIKDNVNQNFNSDANRNFDNEEDPADRALKNSIKKYRYYGQIEAGIVQLLSDHKLLTLIDDRTGKLAFFCIACEYYTLRFRYDSVLSHIFSESHVHNLTCILEADSHIPFVLEEKSANQIKEMNSKFLLTHNVQQEVIGYRCLMCKMSLETLEHSALHILDENHLARLSDKMFRRIRAMNPDGAIPEEWGTKSLDWTKFLAGTGKPTNTRDTVVIENFIRSSGKVANVCSCCDMTLKGPRQVLFNHVRQKKHLRHAAPFKLAMLYKNHCRPAEYFASFGNYYVCAICPKYVALPSFAAIVEHFESPLHIDTIAKLVRSALYDEVDEELLGMNKIVSDDAFKCGFCDVNFKGKSEAIEHVLSNIQHANSVVDSLVHERKCDIISVYMHGNYILHSEGATFSCVPCKSIFNSIRSLLSHLIFAEHFAERPSTESVFRFYLELKHNINMWDRNKYNYYEFGKLKCGVCDVEILEGDNAKKHVVTAEHRENMGATYIQIMDQSGLDC